MKKTQYLITPVAVLAISSILFGCGKTKDDILEKIDEKLNPHSLSRVWEQDNCEDTNLNYWGSSKRIRYEFKGRKAKKKEVYYTDANCKEASITVSYVGKAEVGDEVKKDVKELNLTFNRALVTVHNQSGQTRLNDVKACKKDNWLINESADVTKHADEINCLDTKIPFQVFDIYTVKEGKLYLGRGESKDHLSERPKHLEKKHVFKKL
jgi:hypothetical protein